MSENKEFLIKIVRFLNEPDNSKFISEVDELRHLSGENEEFFMQITNLWNVSSELKDLESIDTEAAVERLSLKLGYGFEERKSSRFIWLRNIAAACLLVTLGYWVYLTVNKPNYLTRTTGSLIDSVTLSDGSLIYLAENSSFRYPEKIKGDTRNVFLLKGEVFFKVSKDDAHPFVVIIDSSKVTVLGTSFNIKNTNRQIELAVRTGKVKFEAPNGKETSILTAGDGLIYYLHTGKTDHFVDGTGSDYAWLTRELTFVDAPLAEVFKSLERCYHVKFKIDQSLSSYSKFNASFKDNKLDEILDILKETYPVKISRNDSLITIKSK